jgi:hypothetical protein
MILVPLCLLVMTLALSGTRAAAQPTALTYQGQLTEGGIAANGLYDLSFAIYDVETNGSPLAILTNAPTGVTGGVLTVTLDFGLGVVRRRRPLAGDRRNDQWRGRL